LSGPSQDKFVRNIFLRPQTVQRELKNLKYKHSDAYFVILRMREISFTLWRIIITTKANFKKKL
jgi:hypothetical protein